MGSSSGKTIAVLLRQINMTLEKNIRSHFSDYGLTVPQISVFALLNRNGDMKISDISSRMGLTNSTTSGIVDRLERMDLVTRVRSDEDRRIVKASLTKKANDLALTFEAKLEESFYHLFCSGSDKDLKDIINGLEKLNNIISDINTNIKENSI